MIKITKSENTQRLRCVMCHDDAVDCHSCSCGALYHDDCAPDHCVILGCGESLSVEVVECNADHLDRDLAEAADLVDAIEARIARRSARRLEAARRATRGLKMTGGGDVSESLSKESALFLKLLSVFMVVALIIAAVALNRYRH